MQGEPGANVIVVTGIRAALHNAENHKGNADVAIDGLTADDIGALPDISISEWLTRIAGDTANDTARGSDQVAIRGLRPDPASTEYNGRILPTADGVNRRVGLGGLPTEGAGRLRTEDARCGCDRRRGVRAELVELDDTLTSEINRLNRDLRETDEKIMSWLRQTDETRRLASVAQVRAHLQGKIAFFLQISAEGPRQLGPDRAVLRDEIIQLEARGDCEGRDIRLKRGESQISEYASQAFAFLPTVAPCAGSELYLSSKEPEVRVIEGDGNATMLRMPDVGSVQNYLAIHNALAFGLQRYFGEVDAPVPGILVLDQISRP